MDALKYQDEDGLLKDLFELKDPELTMLLCKTFIPTGQSC